MMDVSPRVEPRDRILASALLLLEESGRGAVSTRAVSARADVQPQTIYRQFGDMASLLHAVAAHGFDLYFESKSARAPEANAIDDLRAGWDLHVDFGVAHPALFALMYGDAKPASSMESASKAAAMLADLVVAIAREGLLRVDVEPAAAMIHAASTGVALAIISDGSSAYPNLSTNVREAIVSAITVDAPSRSAAVRPTGAVGHAISLRSQLKDNTFGLSHGELALLGELLTKIGSGES